MQIIHYPHPTLRHLSKPLKRVDAELRTSIQKMFELMYEHQGIGLAANQVDLPYRLFVVNVTGDSAVPEEERVFINPTLSGPKGQDEAEEGCLSMPEVHGDVRRAEQITIDAFDLSGAEIHEKASGLLARVFQHETDHIDGRLFIDRLSTTGTMAIRDDLDELEADFRVQRSFGNIPSDEKIAARLAELEKLRT